MTECTKNKIVTHFKTSLTKYYFVTHNILWHITKSLVIVSEWMSAEERKTTDGVKLDRYKQQVAGINRKIKLDFFVLEIGI